MALLISASSEKAQGPQTGSSPPGTDDDSIVRPRTQQSLYRQAAQLIAANRNLCLELDRQVLYHYRKEQSSSVAPSSAPVRIKGAQSLVLQQQHRVETTRSIDAPLYCHQSGGALPFLLYLLGIKPNFLTFTHTLSFQKVKLRYNQPICFSLASLKASQHSDHKLQSLAQAFREQVASTASADEGGATQLSSLGVIEVVGPGSSWPASKVLRAVVQVLRLKEILQACNTQICYDNRRIHPRASIQTLCNLHTWMCGMDHNEFAARDELWQVAADLTDIRTCQIVHAERIHRLERQQDEEARMKSVWGASSPFPGVLSGTPSSGMAESFLQHQLANPVESLNPHANNFDYDENTHLLHNLHLDHGAEPRRGASRANSVRFDESTMHSHWSHESRSSGDFGPERTGSAFGGHRMTERSSSHRSDGRASMTGNSLHSPRANSLIIDIPEPDLEDLNNQPLRPPPGLFVLGPVPAIIRCWINERFSNSTLLYAAICTGAYASTMDFALIQRLKLEDQMVLNNEGAYMIRLPVHFPEAVICQYFTKSSYSTPSVPLLHINFQIMPPYQGEKPNGKPIQVFIGSDTLRLHNADVLFSESKMTIFDHDRDKLSIPLVRPEDDSIFKNLTIGMNAQRMTERDLNEHLVVEQHTASLKSNSSLTEPSNGPHDSGVSVDSHDLRRTSELSISPSRAISPAQDAPNPDNPEPQQPRGRSKNDARASLTNLEIPKESSTGQTESRKSVEFADPKTPARPAPPSASNSTTTTRISPSGGIWSSWRRGDSPRPDGQSPAETGYSPIGPSRARTADSQDTTSRGKGGRGMKVLRTSRSSISKSAMGNGGGGGANNPKDFKRTPAVAQEANWRGLPDANEADKAEGSTTANNSKAQKAGPSTFIGAASAFPWLSPAGK
ncbi:MAG: hypothetical protein M1814_002447 [Vezdaea aestivalis]|nr:MAG: hypothetical protein M1814_002447 [Vezdaea aestivalis]